MMRKLIAGGVLVATIAGGSVAVATVAPIGLAGAQSETESAEVPTPNPGGDHHRAIEVLDGALDDLVAEGTLNQEQADAVRTRVRDRVVEARPGDGQGRGHGRRSFGFVKEALEPVAETLGMTAEELGQALRDGSTLNQLADTAGVDRGVVRQQIIDSASVRIDQAVADGKVDADRAEAAKAKAPELVDRFMEEGAHRLGRGEGWGRHRGAAGEAPAPDDGGG